MDKKRGLLLVLITALISGVSIFINKFGVSGINPYIFTFGKNVLAFIFLFSVILALRKYKTLKGLHLKDWLKLVVVGLVGGSLPFLLFFKGLSLTTGVMGSFLHKTMFVYVIVLAALFLREKINKKVVFGALLLLIGNFLFLKLNSFTFNVGDLLVLVATLFWAAENTISKYFLKDMDATVLAFGRMFFGSGFILVFLLASGNVHSLVSLTLPQLSWMLVTSLFLFAYLITWYHGLKRIDVSMATCILLIGSPVTTILSYTFLGSALSLFQVAGAFSLLTGLLIIISSKYALLRSYSHEKGLC